MARQLAERIAAELDVPTYCYEAAAFRPERKNLAVCRKGEYEALAERADKDGEAPDSDVVRSMKRWPKVALRLSGHAIS